MDDKEAGRAKEKTDLAAETTQHEKLVAARAEMKEAKDKLDRVEAKTEPGAPVMAPKARLLDASGLEKKNPNKYYRYGTLNNPDKLEVRTEAEGYKRVEVAGVKEKVGPMVLLEQPRELHEQRVERQEKENKRRMEMHKRGAEETAEAIVKTLKDQHGIDVPIERFLINE